MGFQDSSWNISMSSLVMILLHRFLRRRAEKQTDKHTYKAGENPISAIAGGMGIEAKLATFRKAAAKNKTR